MKNEPTLDILRDKVLISVYSRSPFDCKIPKDMISCYAIRLDIGHGTVYLENIENKIVIRDVLPLSCEEIKTKTYWVCRDRDNFWFSLRGCRIMGAKQETQSELKIIFSEGTTVIIQTGSTADVVIEDWPNNLPLLIASKQLNGGKCGGRRGDRIV